jgi:single-stranded DNA-binding protein
MSIDSLVCGRIYGQPQKRTSKNGNPFITAKVRAAMRDTEGQVFCNVICFSESASQVLAALSDGDTVAVAGELKVNVYTDKQGQAQPSLDLLAHQVLTPYAVKRKRSAVRGEEGADGEAPAAGRPRSALDQLERSPWPGAELRARSATPAREAGRELNEPF